MYNHGFDRLAKQLNEQLNKKDTLIGFNVPGSVETSLKYPGSPLDALMVEWRIRIANRPLSGVQWVSLNIIEDSAIDIANIVINDAMNFITQAILHPDEIPEAKFTIT